MKNKKHSNPTPSSSLTLLPEKAEAVTAKPQRPDPEVLPSAKRRRFSAKYKLRILEQADSCTKPGELGALLRREGLYHSNLDTWRRQRAEGTLQALSPKKRGPKPDPDKALLKKIASLEKDKERMAEKLRKAELIIEVQKKVLGLAEETGTEEKEKPTK